MWVGASKTSVCFSGYKSITINSQLQCDKDFDKYTPESLINS